MFAANPKIVEVQNVIPTLTISGLPTVEVGAPFELNLASTDPGNDTIIGWWIDWGDGTSLQLLEGSPRRATHSYSRSGTYFVKAHAFDEDYAGPRYSTSNSSGSSTSPFSTDWVSNEISVTATSEPNRWLPTIDFERSATGAKLKSGDRITDQFAALGMTVSTNSASHPAMIFNSAAPTGGDTDLGTPSSHFGGPGIGSGGVGGAGR